MLFSSLPEENARYGFCCTALYGVLDRREQASFPIQEYISVKTQKRHFSNIQVVYPTTLFVSSASFVIKHQVSGYCRGTARIVTNLGYP